VPFLAATAAEAAPANRLTVGGLFPLAAHGGSVTVSGWSADRDDPAAPVRVSVTVDGRVRTHTVTSLPRPRMARLHHVGPDSGYLVRVPLASGTHKVCATARDLETGTESRLNCRSVTIASVNAAIAHEAARYVGYRYVEGGASPRTGFDCSGLVSWVYAKAAGITIAHFAETQFRVARQISESAARPGDLVFFHDGGGYVYHVGIYAGGHMMWAAATPADGVRHQAIWSSAVTYGTLTH
jgi:cell wall-associated NlpC family hydrolase